MLAFMALRNELCSPEGTQKAISKLLPVCVVRMAVHNYGMTRISEAFIVKHQSGTAFTCLTLTVESYENASLLRCYALSTGK
jgi:hypothetical protein